MTIKPANATDAAELLLDIARALINTWGMDEAEVMAELDRRRDIDDSASEAALGELESHLP